MSIQNGRCLILFWIDIREPNTTEGKEDVAFSQWVVGKEMDRVLVDGINTPIESWWASLVVIKTDPHGSVSIIESRILLYFQTAGNYFEWTKSLKKCEEAQ